MRHLTLREYQTTQGEPLTLAERNALRAYVDIAPSSVVEGCYDLTPGASVGAINLDTLAVTIQPKLPIDRLLFLISYALAHERWRDIPFDLEQRDELVEAIVPGFVAQVRRALRRGVLQGYRTEEDALQTVRGRICFDEQLRRRQGRLPPVELRFDEFTTDIEENRLLKAAIHRLRRLRLRSPVSRHALEAFEDALSEVQLVEYDARRLPELHWTRLNDRYRPAVELAQLVLRAVSFELGHGGVAASAFLLNMNEVFNYCPQSAYPASLGQPQWPRSGGVMSYFNSAKTQNNYVLSEATSALQKALRQGQEELAFTMALEVVSVNATMLWNRLATIASEDVGLADPSMPVLIETLRRSFEDAMRRKNPSAQLFLAHAVLALARAPKSRLVDNFLLAVATRSDNPALPDVSYDKHMSAGKRMGRGWGHFWAEGTQLENHAEQDGESDYRQEAMARLQESGGKLNWRVDLTEPKGKAKDDEPEQQRLL